MYCYKCGYELNHEMTYCPKCGTKKFEMIVENNEQDQGKRRRSRHVAIKADEEPSANDRFGGQTSSTEALGSFSHKIEDVDKKIIAENTKKGDTALSVDLSVNKKTINLKPLPMKWHHFLVCFALWFGAIYTLSAGAAMFYITYWNINGIDYTVIFNYFPGLKSLFRFYGVFLCALAIFQLIVWITLAFRKKYAPRLYRIVLLISAIAPLVFYFITVSITGSFRTSSVTGIIASTIVGLIMYIVSRIYYGKREFMFSN